MGIPTAVLVDDWRVAAEAYTSFVECVPAGIGSMTASKQIKQAIPTSSYAPPRKCPDSFDQWLALSFKHCCTDLCAVRASDPPKVKARMYHVGYEGGSSLSVMVATFT
jgi:hypothetical protein